MAHNIASLFQARKDDIDVSSMAFFSISRDHNLHGINEVVREVARTDFSQIKIQLHLKQ